MARLLPIETGDAGITGRPVGSHDALSCTDALNACPGARLHGLLADRRPSADRAPHEWCATFRRMALSRRLG
jgi:hypothetical protein